MNSLQRERWVDEVLAEVMMALMHDEALCQALIFKGARILNLHLKDSRQSMDIDATAEPAWADAMGSLEAQEAFLDGRLARAVQQHFESHDPVRFTLENAKISRRPSNHHPRGWDMLCASLLVKDHSKAHMRSLPAIELEISAVESYGSDAVEQRNFLGVSANVYALHRIAGEKLRAYLTSLPEYRAKMHGGTREFRVKDLHDLARIVRHRPLTDTKFWLKAMQEFRLACESRLVDCSDPETFKQAWAQARQRYEQDAHLIPIPFEEVEVALDGILTLFSAKGVFPLLFPLVPEN
ncbi:MAG: nucleotidyl transferase AbiEii/AbiGii toxin family protein [Prosthecobacter sp.]